MDEVLFVLVVADLYHLPLQDDKLEDVDAF